MGATDRDALPERSAPVETGERDPWVLETLAPRPEPLYLSNGYMGMSLGWDGGALLESVASDCYIRGLYSRSGPDGVDRLAVLPGWNWVRYGVPAAVLDYRRRFDLRQALVTTTLTLEEERGIVRLQQEIFLSRADPHLGVLRLAVTPEFDGDVALLVGLHVRPGGDLDVREAGSDVDRLWLRGHVPTYGIDVAAVVSLQAGSWSAADEHVGQTELRKRLSSRVRAGSTAHVVQTMRLCTSLEGAEQLSPPLPASPDFETALREHRRSWERLWETDIEIEGDPEAQAFVRAGLAYLWSSVWEEDRWSIAPMGLSGNGYNGHIFWDAELWMYPSLLVTHPALAQACVAYRECTIDAARQRAARNGFNGAQFPWEGAFTGEEMTPSWAQTGDFQLHITADVAIGQWWYYLNTLDLEWLRLHGFPVIKECAEFWASRVEWNSARGRYEISDVVCADEYAEHVDNDAFTNAAVRLALLVAVRAAGLLGEKAPPEWKLIAEKIHVPYDAAGQIHLEFDGYDGRVTKQADVELLTFPLEYIDDRDQVARDLDYYAGVIDANGPAMSFSVYAIISAQLGRARQAYDYLRRSFVPNTQGPFWSFSETPTNNEFFFCTGVGGALQAILFGFTGLRLREGHFSVRPVLPPHWSALRLRNLFIAGGRTDIEIEPGTLAVRRCIFRREVAITCHFARGRTTVSIDHAPAGAAVEIASAAGDTIDRVLVARSPALELPRRPDGVRVRVIQGDAALLDVHLAGEGDT
ncbi:MAG TPA: glycoside hydrolase family 65 protein [Chloroflexota bacterium]|nr:glycoside hydrolase family 65 protein [Chloroflexota bacterium]